MLNRPGRCLKLFVSTESTSSHEFASQFGLYQFVYVRKTCRNCVTRASVYFNGAATGRKETVTVSPLVASDTPNRDNLNGDNCSQRSNRLSQNGEKATSQNGTTRVYTFMPYTIWLRNYYVAHAFVVCNDYYSVCDVFEI